MHIEKKTLRNIFLVVVACIIVYWLLNETAKVMAVLGFIRKIFAPFAAGAAIALVMNVPMRFVERKLEKIKKPNIRRAVALVITLVLMLLVLCLVFVLLIPQVVNTVKVLAPQLEAFVINAQGNLYNFIGNYPDLLEWATKAGIMDLDWAGLAEKVITIVSNSLTTILSRTFSAISVVSSFLVNFIIALVFSIYCLFQKDTLARQGRKLLYSFIPEKVADEIVRVLRMSYATFANFLSGQSIEVIILGCMFAVAMAIFRMPYIPLVSVLVAVTAFVPIVGAFVGCIVGAFLMLVNNPLQALGFVTLFLIIQQIEGNLIYPKVVGNSIGLSGMWVLMAVTVGGSLFGVVGMILMIPVASVIHTLLREFTQRRLEDKQIDAEKLKPQPPILRSNIRKRRENWKKKKITAKNKDFKTDSQEE